MCAYREGKRKGSPSVFMRHQSCMLAGNRRVVEDKVASRCLTSKYYSSGVEGNSVDRFPPLFGNGQYHEERFSTRNFNVQLCFSGGGVQICILEIAIFY